VRFRLPAKGLALALLAVGSLPGCSTLASRGAFAGCQAADTVTTLEAMKGGARELNPVVAAIFATLGPAGFVAAKLGITVLVLHEYSAVSSGVVAVASGVTCAAAANNAIVMRRRAKEARAP
jgi:hypothetical protein